MKLGQTTMAVAAIAAMLVVAVAVAYALKAHKAAQAEGFESTLPDRPCAVYFTENIDACDHPKNLYQMRDNELIDRYTQLERKGNERTAEETVEYNAIKSVHADRTKVPLNGTVCKLTFKDWKEQGDAPRKIAGPASAQRGPPEHWAYCYRNDVNDAETRRVATEFGDRGAVKFDEYTDGRGDGKMHARVQFKDLGFDAVQTAYCSMMPPASLGADFPLLVGFSLTGNTITGTDVYQRSIRGGGSSITTYPDTAGSYKHFFETRQKGRSFVYTPRVVTGTVYVMGIDECSRAKVIRTEPIAFSLERFGVTDKVLVPNLASVGKEGNVINMQSIVTTYNGLLAQQRSKLAQIAGGAGGGGSTGTPLYRQGLIRSHYNIPNIYRHRDYWYGGPSANNAPDLTALMVPDNLESQAADPNIPYLTGADPHEYLRVWDGFIRIDVEDTYYFKISTDDAGDLVINGTLVAHHYGYHGADDGGVVASSIRLTVGYHKVQLRVFEWHGGHGVRYILWRRSAAGFTHLPSANLAYDANSATVQEALAGLTNINRSLGALKPYFDSATQDISTHIPEMMGKVAGKSVNSVFNQSHISSDGRVYIALGAQSVTTQNTIDEPWNNTERQDIHTAITNIATTPLSLNTPDINFSTLPVYTVSLWIKIERGFNQWRNIFYLGEKEMDRTPALWVYPDNTMRLHFRQHSSHWNNWGVDVTDTSKLPAFGEWFNYTVTANKTSVQVYINGNQVAAGSTPGSHTMVWNAGTNFGEKKRFYLNLASSYPSQNGGVHVQKVSWFNRALSPSEITNLASEVKVEYVRGRYVRLQRRSWPPGGQGQGYLNILELGGFGRNGARLSSRASLGPQYGGANVFGPQFLIDNNVRRDWWTAGSGTGLPHTTNDANSYMELDLGGMNEIASLLIENRRDCCTSRIIGTELQVLDDNRKIVWSMPIQSDQATYRYKTVL